MRIAFAILAASLVAVTPLEAVAEEHCYKPRIGNDPMSAESRACRLNAIFDEWFAARDIKTEWWVQVFDRVDLIADNQRLFEVVTVKPWARVEVYFLFSKQEAIAATETIKFRPGYFDSLEAMLKSQAKTIVCGTVNESEKAFIVAGGEIDYVVGLKASVFEDGTPNWFASVEIPQTSCEAN